jgi:hypothetical protein
MKRKMIPLLNLFIVISLLCVVSGASGEEYTAMKGIESAKAVFDERESNPKNTAFHLTGVHQTYKELAAMKKNPVFLEAPKRDLIPARNSGVALISPSVGLPNL